MKKIGHKRFYELIKRMEETHARKNHDYAKDTDPLSNLRVAEEFGIPAWKGVLIRMTDKYSRIKELAHKDALVKEESITDTLLDLAIYALLCIILLEEDDEKRT